MTHNCNEIIDIREFLFPSVFCTITTATATTTVITISRVAAVADDCPDLRALPLAHFREYYLELHFQVALRLLLLVNVCLLELCYC